MTKAQHKWIAQYTPAEVLAISFEVFAEQGFIKSGHGYSRPTGELDNEGNQVYKQISDNTIRNWSPAIYGQNVHLR